MNSLKRSLALLLSCLLMGCATKTEWIQLFDGKNLDHWQVKITGHELGDNYGDTFRVDQGILKVAYDRYDQFDGKFGHLFYQTPFSHYRLRIEYRFVGEQVAGGPGWALRNNGIMLHCQSPQSMATDQDFPASIEVQLLGGRGEGTRPTANVCTPGTHIVMDGELITRHCVDSSSKTYHGDQWVEVEIEVRGSEIIRHIIDGETVLSYAEPQLDEETAKARGLREADSKLLDSGYISIQAESHPTEFRRIELLRLGRR